MQDVLLKAVAAKRVKTITLQPGQTIKEPVGSWIIEFYCNDNNQVKARAVPTADGVELVCSPRVIEELL